MVVGTPSQVALLEQGLGQKDPTAAILCLLLLCSAPPGWLSISPQAYVVVFTDIDSLSFLIINICWFVPTNL